MTSISTKRGSSLPLPGLDGNNKVTRSYQHEGQALQDPRGPSQRLRGPMCTPRHPRETGRPDCTTRMDAKEQKPSLLGELDRDQRSRCTRQPSSYHDSTDCREGRTSGNPGNLQSHQSWVSTRDASQAAETYPHGPDARRGNRRQGTVRDSRLHRDPNQILDVHIPKRPA